MSLLSNPNSTRYGVVYTWNTDWVEFNNTYTLLNYIDIHVKLFIDGINYKNNMPSALPIIRNIGYEKIMIFNESLIYYRKKKSKKHNKWRRYFNKIVTFRRKYRKILYFINRVFKYNNIKKINVIKKKNIINNLILYRKNNKNKKLILNNSIKNNKYIIKKKIYFVAKKITDIRIKSLLNIINNNRKNN